MFNNIGRTIKRVTKTVCIITMIVSVVAGIALIIIGADTYHGETLVISGIAIAVVGGLLSWLSALILYAYGETTENVLAIASILVKRETKKEMINKETE